MNTERGLSGFGDRNGQIVAEESRGGLKQLVTSLFVAGKPTTAQKGYLVPREEWSGLHVVLPNPSPNDDVADFEPGLSRSGNASEEDLGDAEIGNQVHCRGSRGDFAPSRKDHDYGLAPKRTRVLGPPSAFDDFRLRRQLVQEGVYFLLHGGHDSNGHGDSVAT